MAILTPPSTFCGPLSTTFMLSSLPTTSPVSSFNQRQSVSGPISEFWRAQIVLHGAGAGTSAKPGWRDTAAFIQSLRGGANRVRLFDARRTKLRGSGGVLPTLALDDTYMAGATSIRVKGLIPSQTIALARDDHFSIGENLYTVIENAGSDGSGEATVNFLPPLRHGVLENDSINLNKPTGAFRLVGGYMDMAVPHYMTTQPMTLEFFEDPEWEA